MDYLLFILPQYLYDLAQDIFAVILLNLTFYEFCRGTSVWVGLVVFIFLSMYIQHLGRVNHSTIEVAEHEVQQEDEIEAQDENDPFAIMGIEPTIKKKKKTRR